MKQVCMHIHAQYASFHKLQKITLSSSRLMLVPLATHHPSDDSCSSDDGVLRLSDTENDSDTPTTSSISKGKSTANADDVQLGCCSTVW